MIDEALQPIFPPAFEPATIRDAWVDEERAKFEDAFRDAIDAASTSMDLTGVFDVLCDYQPIATLSRQRRGEVGQTGEVPPENMTGTELCALVMRRLMDPTQA